MGFWNPGLGWGREAWNFIAAETVLLFLCLLSRHLFASVTLLQAELTCLCGLGSQKFRETRVRGAAPSVQTLHTKAPLQTMASACRRSEATSHPPTLPTDARDSGDPEMAAC